MKTLINSLLNNGKTKPLPLETILPTIFLPLLVYFSTLSFWFTIVIIFFLLPALLCHVYLIFRFNLPKKNFFYVWSIISVFFVFICFEFFIVPLMVISPSENIAFFLLFCVMLVYAKKTQTKVLHPTKSEKFRPLSNQQNKACIGCCLKITTKDSLCGSCQTSATFKRGYYNAWINCSIVQTNHKTYCILMLFSILWLAYTSYLILTTICQSYLIFNLILVPSDCSNVYTTTRSSICFVSVLYSLEIIVFIGVMLTREFVSRPISTASK